MKIVVDDKIPYIRGVVERFADQVVYLPGRSISAADVRDADALIVRTRTRCDEALLSGSSVRFIATATIGYDHLDTAYLERAGIVWTNCPGCNATSVAQYVRNTCYLLQREKGLDLKSLTLGIIGVGHVGKRVLEAVEPLFKRVLLNDPPRQDKEGDAGFSPLDDMLRECDIITIHTPLVMGGKHPSYHLIDAAALAKMQSHAVLINCGRGEVVDNTALEAALDKHLIAEAVIDTWENEPDIRRSLLGKVYIGTPHVAGYSADGKANATRMSLTALCQWMHREPDFTISAPALPASLILSSDPIERALQLYNPKDDSARLKAHPEDFEALRGNYPLRRETAD